jgi:hypothetical protein
LLRLSDFLGVEPSHPTTLSTSLFSYAFLLSTQSLLLVLTVTFTASIALVSTLSSTSTYIAATPSNVGSSTPSVKTKASFRSSDLCALAAHLHKHSSTVLGI